MQSARPKTVTSLADTIPVQRKRRRPARAKSKRTRQPAWKYASKRGILLERVGVPSYWLGIQVFMVQEPVNRRKRFDGLSAALETASAAPSATGCLWPAAHGCMPTTQKRKARTSRYLVVGRQTPAEDAALLLLYPVAVLAVDDAIAVDVAIQVSA